MRGEDPVARFGSKADLDQEEIDKLRQEIVSLKTRIEELERKNRILKQRNYDLTISYSRDSNNRSRPMPITLDLSKLDDVNESTGSVISNLDKIDNQKEFGDGLNEALNIEKIGETLSKNDQVQNNNKTDYVELSRNNTGSNKALESDLQAINHEKQNPVSSSRELDDTKISFPLDGTKLQPGAKNSLVPESPAPTKRNQLGNTDINKRASKMNQFVVNGELIGHKGAIYAVEYSGTREWLASGSFDKTVRIWDSIDCKQIACLEGHKMSVSTLSWSDSALKTTLVSGGFDRQLIEWDLGLMKRSCDFKAKGLVQSVIYDKHDADLIFCGSSSGDIELFDTRSGEHSSIIGRTNSPISTLVQLNDNNVLSSDLDGCVYMWDIRKKSSSQETYSQLLLKLGAAISNISLTVQERTSVAYLAVNAYDDVLRIYDRINIPNSSQSSMLDTKLAESSLPSGNAGFGYDYTPRLISQIKGISNCNWPIRSTFFNESAVIDLLQRNSVLSKNTFDFDGASRSTIQDELRSRLIIATGSAEPNAYVYWINTQQQSYNKPPISQRMFDQTSPDTESTQSSYNFGFSGAHGAKNFVGDSPIDISAKPKPQVLSQNDKWISSSIENKTPVQAQAQALTNDNVDGSSNGISADLHEFSNSPLSNSNSDRGYLNTDTANADSAEPSHVFNQMKSDGIIWSQRLEGHSDRVYTVATHKSLVQMCTASADSTILVWNGSKYFGKI